MAATQRRLRSLNAHLAPAPSAGILGWLSSLFGGGSDGDEGSSADAEGEAPAGPREQLAPHEPLSSSELFAALDSTYGHVLDPLNYVRGIGVCARLRFALMMGDASGAAVELAREFAAAAPPASEMEPVSASAFAFLEELASLTDDQSEKEAIMKPLLDFAQRYIDEADAETGRAEELLNEGNWCEDLFFAGVILGRAFGFTQDPKFADMCCHLLLTNQNQRESGLYNHADHSPNAWSRGNGFAAAGYSEALGYLEPAHPRYAELLARHTRHIEALCAHQGEDGTWHQIVDDPSSFHELTSTGLIGYAISHGLAGGWLKRSPEVDGTLDNAITAVRSRIDAEGNVKGGCQSTGPLPSTEAYLAHPILDGIYDDRTGSVCFWFAVAHAQNPNRA